MVFLTGWTGSQAAGYGFINPVPAAQPLQVPVATTAGDWLFVIAAWRQPQAGQGVSVCVADDAHNWWDPVGAPAADSPAAGTVRTAVWAAPAARVARYVQVAPTGPCTALAAIVLDATGLSPWWQVAGITGGDAQSATSLGPLSLPAPSSSSLVLAALACDNTSAVLSDSGSGWTTVTTVTASNGVDHLSDIQLLAQAQVAGAGVSATLGATVASDLAGTLAGVLISAPAPVQLSPGWPVVITEAAIGSGPQTPPSQMTWTSLSPRRLAASVQQGRQYTLSQLQAAQGTMTLDNPDGALIPPGTGAFAGVDSGTPVRQRVIAPLAAASLGTADGTFESGVSQWQAFNGTVVQSSAQHHSGSFSAQVTATTSTLSTYLRPAAGFYVPVIPGQYYTIPLWVLAAQSGNTFGAVIDWLPDATGLTVLSSSGGPTSSPAAFTWAQVTVTAQAPAGAAWMRYGPTMAPTTSGDWYYVDDVLATPALTPHYVAAHGYLKRWPWAAPGDMLRGESQCEITDTWAYAAGSLDSMARQEMLLDNPYAMWPLSDPAGSTAGSNLAPGNANPLTQVVSKYGAAGATTTWGAAPSGGGLPGDTSARVTSSGKTTSASGMFQQQLPASALSGAAGYGYALGCNDSGYPPLAGGVTIEAWAAGGMSTPGFTNVGNVLTTNGTLANGQPVTFSAAAGFTLPTGISVGTVYWVINVSGSSCEVSATLGGSAVTLSTNGGGFITTTTPYDPVIWSARNVKGTVASLAVRNTDGALLLQYQTASGSTSTVVVDTGQDYRTFGLSHYSVALTRTTWRALGDGGGLFSASGTFSSSLAAYFDELWAGGVQDRATQGFAYAGFLGLVAIYPGILPQSRVISHYGAASYGLRNDTAATRVERAVEYAGIAGRRLILQQSALPYGQQDDVASGQDVGGNSAATMASNIGQSTIPALLYVAPTGDVVYWSKQFSYNQPVKWTLGDNVAGGEIPFTLGQFSTDYDPSRVVDDVQLTQLDTQSLTIPAGVMSATTVAAIEAAAQAQYGDIPLQATGYLQYDYGVPYTQGSTLIDLANWAAMVYRKPANRVQAVTVQAAASSAGASIPQRWQLWAGASVGDMVAVNVRMPTAATSPLISMTARITQTSRSMKWSVEGVEATIGLVLDFAPEFNALTCDDATRGLLNGSNVLAW